MMKWLCILLFGIVAAAPAWAENWPRFRGPTGQGISSEKGLPQKWTPTENIAWKTEIPGKSWSSPIVWDNRVFLTTATDGGASCHVLCLERDTGKIVWDKEVLRQPLKNKQEKNSHATSTPVTDGERIYVAFNDGSLAALNFDGSVVWVNRDFPFYSQHGLGTSPILHGDLLIMSRDGSDEKGVGWQTPWDKGFILALEKKTGKLVWKATRGQSRIAHVTPLVITEEGKDVLLSPAGDVVQAFDLKTGDRLWTARSEGESPVPSPVAGDGLVFTASGWPNLTIRAVRTGGQGEVTKTHIAWEHKQNVPAIPSFLYLKPHLYTVSTEGIASCLNAADGKVIWTERLNGKFSASIYADGAIYFLSEGGETTVIEPGPKFNVVARNKLNETTQASMAVSAGRLFIRTESKLYCIKQKE